MPFVTLMPKLIATVLTYHFSSDYLWRIFSVLTSKTSLFAYILRQLEVWKKISSHSLN